jgi:DNA repair ATPase RecN
MTVFGKILVFVNLAFSLLVAGLIMMAYVARTNWHDAYKRQENELTAARTSADQYAAEAKKARDDGEARANALKATIEQRTRELDAAIADAKTAKEALANKETTIDKSNTGIKVTQGEVERLTAQAKSLQQRVDDDAKRLDDAAIAINESRKLKVEAEIKAKGLLERNSQLAQALEEREKEIVRLKAAPGGAATVAANVPNPPPGNVEGLIKSMDASSGLVTITIGSDAGIAKGHTLQVYRLKPTGKYVGEIQIRDVRAHEAVGKFMSKPLTPVQVGDTVASKIS